MSFPVTMAIDVLWGDMDALGHVNNARFFVWFEAARIATFARIGIKVDEPSETGPILATTTCDFLKPVTFPAKLEVGCRIPKVGNTSFVTEYAIWHEGAQADLVARGSGVVVMFNYRSGDKLRVSDELRASIRDLHA